VLFEATAAVLAAAPGEGARFLGIVFEEAGRVAVICVEPLSSNVGVRFGHNSWRADTFETELREAIDAASASPDGNINILPGAVPTTKERK
jgi:hypothetical protein